MSDAFLENSAPIAFKRVVSVDSNSFDQAIKIYTGSFPVNERHPVTVIKERVIKGLNELYTGVINNEVVFIALLWPLRGTDFILLDYMATHTGHRNKKIAARFLDHMKLFLTENKKYFVLEVEDPLAGQNQQERQQRIDFYKKNGAQQLEGIQYTLPALQGAGTTAMWLMIFPEYPGNYIAAAIIKKLIIQIYQELYGRSEKLALLNSSGYTGKTTIALS